MALQKLEERAGTSQGDQHFFGVPPGAHLAKNVHYLFSCRMNTYRRILRGAELTHPYWVALPEEKCIGQNSFALRDFCEERGLSLSRHGRALPRCEGYYQIFMFSEEAHAEVFSREFNGTRMHAAERTKPRNLK